MNFKQALQTDLLALFFSRAKRKRAPYRALFLSQFSPCLGCGLCLGLCLGLTARPGAAAESEGEQRGLVLSEKARWLSPRADGAEGKPVRRRGLPVVG